MPGFASRGDEDAGGTITKGHHCGDVIFDFDVVPLATTCHRVNAGWHAKEPLPEVELVRALIQEDTATFAGPCRAPTARGVIGFGSEPISDDPIHPADFLLIRRHQSGL